MANEFESQEELEKANTKTLLAASMKGFGQLAGGFASSRSAALKSLVYRQNAAALKVAAEEERKKGTQKFQERKQKAAQTIGRQKAALAANGIVIGIDTALDIVVQTATIGAADALTALDNAERQATKLLQEAEFEKTKAGVAKAKGTAELVTGAVSGFATILGGLGTVAERRRKFKVPTTKRSV